MNNPPAFPTKQYDEDNDISFYPGMSLQTHFMGRALTGILANPEGHPPTFESAADEAYKYAQACMERLEREKDDKPE